MNAARRLSLAVLATLCTLTGALVFAGTPAVAAAPEAPEVTVESVKASEATFHGVLNPGKAGVAGTYELGTYEFLYAKSDSTCEGEGKVPVPPGMSLGGGKEVVSQVVSGLQPGAEYMVCVRATNTLGESAVSSPVAFTTFTAAPTIREEAPASVEETAAGLEAQIDPDGLETTYHFEYDTVPYETSVSHGTSLPVPSVGVGTGTSPVPVSVQVKGLTPGTTYYYRVVAVNGLGTVDGTGKALVTPSPSSGKFAGSCSNERLRVEQSYGLQLPDCRAYEMVSPVEKNGNDAVEIERGVNVGSNRGRAAVSGDAFEFQSLGSFADPAGSNFRNEFISRRGAGGWGTQSITPPVKQFQQELMESYGALAFTPELSKGVAESNDPLLSEAPVGDWQLFVADFADGSYQWVSNVPEAQDMAPYEEAPRNFVVKGSSTDLSHVVFSFGPEAGDFSQVAFDQVAFEWVEGHGKPVLVTVANSGEAMQSGVGSGEGFAANIWRAVSSDGSRVFFTAGGQLYVRENAEQSQSPMDGEKCADSGDACTVEVSASQRAVADPHGPQSAGYWGASVDGSRVFFTSNAELTEDAYTGPEDNAANLYEYDLERPEGERLRDLSVDTADVAEGAAVLGVAQVSEDGSYVYFVARGDLGGEAKSGEPNLYVSYEGGAPRFIATLAVNDSSDWGIKGGK